MFVPRRNAARRIADSFRVHPAVALTGPRQCGKTTLAEQVAAAHVDEHGSGSATRFDLERAADRLRLQTPEQTLSPLTGLVVIDEIQREPGLFETLRVLLDRRDEPARFLLLGSASPVLASGASETLAGRVGLVDLFGFDLTEVSPTAWRALWQRGGFPRSYLAPDEAASSLWRGTFTETFLLRDIVALGINVPVEALRRFWTMVAHYHGQVWNAAEIRSGDRCWRGRRTPPSRHLGGGRHGASAAAMVREPEKAPGSCAKDLRSRHGPPAQPARVRHRQ